VVAALAGSTTLTDARIVATAVELPRALPADDLAAIWERAPAAPAARTGPAGRHVRRAVSAEPDLGAALDRILAGPPGPLVVAGSLYLVGAVRGRLVDDPLLRDPNPGDNRVDDGTHARP
jgi:folylpolyglutamate synthase/dihydropteroate synthase